MKKAFIDSWTNKKGKWLFLFGLIVGGGISAYWSINYDHFFNWIPLALCFFPFVIVTVVNMFIYEDDELSEK